MTPSGEVQGPRERPALRFWAWPRRVLCEQEGPSGRRGGDAETLPVLGGVEGTRVLGLLYSEWGTLAFLERKGICEGLSKVQATGHAAPRAREGPARIRVHRPVAAATSTSVCT